MAYIVTFFVGEMCKFFVCGVFYVIVQPKGSYEKENQANGRQSKKEGFNTPLRHDYKSHCKAAKALIPCAG